MNSEPSVKPIGEVFELTNGYAFKSADFVHKGVPLVRISNIQDESVILDESVCVAEKDEYAKFLIEDGDILIALSGATTGKFGVYSSPKKAYLNQRVARFRSRPNGPLTKYLYYFLHLKRSEILAAAYGGAQPNISTKQIAAMEIPIFSPGKCNLMVESLDYLFSEIDSGTEELRKAKQKLELYKQSVLNAAIQGKLVPQDPNDEPASKLLERIRAEKEQLIKAKKIKKEKPLPPISPDEVPFELPKGWEWVRLGELLLWIQSGKSFKCDERPPSNAEVGVVKVSAVTWGDYNESESKTCTDRRRVNEDIYIKQGDFLFSRANTIELVGAAVIADKISRRIMLSDKILRIHFMDNSLKPWVLQCLRSSFGRGQIQNYSSGNQESMRNISQDGIRRIILPLPPANARNDATNIIHLCYQTFHKTAEAIADTSRGVGALKQSILKSAFEGKLL